jgi:hypothetical protein
MKKRKAWTLAEDQFIANHAGKLSAQEMGKQLNRTHVSVKCRARRIGVNLQRYGENHHLAKTSNHDIELCRALNEENIKPKAIAEKMDISISLVYSVINYRCRLNG